MRYTYDRTFQAYFNLQIDRSAINRYFLEIGKIDANGFPFTGNLVGNTPLTFHIDATTGRGFKLRIRAGAITIKQSTYRIGCTINPADPVNAIFNGNILNINKYNPVYIDAQAGAGAGALDDLEDVDIDQTNLRDCHGIYYDASTSTYKNAHSTEESFAYEYETGGGAPSGNGKFTITSTGDAWNLTTQLNFDKEDVNNETVNFGDLSIINRRITITRPTVRSTNAEFTNTAGIIDNSSYWTLTVLHVNSTPADAVDGKCYEIGLSPINILTDLADVSISGVSNNDILIYNSGSSTWQNQPSTSSNVGHSLTWTDTTTPTGEEIAKVGTTLYIWHESQGNSLISLFTPGSSVYVFETGSSGRYAQWHIPSSSTVTSDDPVLNSWSFSDVVEIFNNLTASDTVRAFIFENRLTLDGLNDTSLISPTEGQVVKYNSTSTQWENQDNSLVTLADVAIPNIPYDNINADFSPDARWVAGDITGSPGSFTWLDQIGGLGIFNQVTANSSITTIGSTAKSALFMSSAGQGQIRLNTPNIDQSTNSGFTLVYIGQDWVDVSGVPYNGSFIAVSMQPGSVGIGNAPNALNHLPHRSPTLDEGTIWDSVIGFFPNILHTYIATSAGTPHMNIIRWDGTTWDIYANGVNVYTTVAGSGVNTNFLSIQNGAGSANGVPHQNHKFAEIILFDRPLTNPEITDLSSRLDQEYGIIPAPPPLSDNDMIVYNSTDSKWENQPAVLNTLSDASTGGGLGNIVGDRLTFTGSTYGVVDDWNNLSLPGAAISFENFGAALTIINPVAFTLVPFVGVLQTGAFQVSTNNLGRLTMDDGFSWSCQIFFSAAVTGNNATEWEVALYKNGTTKIANSYVTTIAASSRFSSITGVWSELLRGTLHGGGGPYNDYVEIFIRRNLGAGDADIGSAYLSVSAVKLEDRPA